MVSRLRYVLIIFLVGYTTLAQPGLCPCWLIADVKDVHPHPNGHPELPHSHDYLQDMFKTSGAPALPTVILSVAALLAWLSSGNLYRWLSTHRLTWADWRQPPLLPPPRPFAFS